MATTFKTPGVYMEQVNLLLAVAPVATAIPAFVGYTEKIPALISGSIPPVRITSMLEYESIFGGPDRRVVAVLGAANTTVTSIVDYGAVHILYYAVKLYFDNGGGPCYIASAGIYPVAGAVQVSKPTLQAAIVLLESEDEPTLLVVPEATQLASIISWADVSKDLLNQCAKLQDRFAILDTYERSSIVTEMNDFRSNIGTQNLKYGAAYYPRLNTAIPYQYEASDNAVIHVQLVSLAYKSITAALVADITPGMVTTIKAAIADQNFGARTMTLPPSAAIAGIYASVDRTRGVWKAPANVSLTSVSAPALLLTNAEQEDLNVDSTTGKSINAIRSFTGKGIMVWGARTLDGNSNEWRYVSVRRLFILLEESIKKATQFVVFEPNDENSWLRVRNMAQNFLNGLWRQGALSGTKPEDAYFVNVGLGESMTAQDILEGKLIIEIGVAAVRPAEFIVLRFMHKVQQS